MHKAMRYHADMKKNLAHVDKKQQLASLLGGISPERFLADYWQKKPLLIRAAIPSFQGLLDPNELAGLACEDEVQSRLVIQQRDKWKLESGPFEENRFAKLPETNWTLLVQSVNHHLQEATDLLQHFDFIPHARLDDLMVSYAPDGGGVGPHFDSYDVFLLQGQGKRLWRVSAQDDLSLVDGAPLRILENFQVEQEYLLEAGDMLYLPPHLAHWGIAVGDCMTYSIGFRAPAAKELTQEFLSFLHDDLASTQSHAGSMYSDPDLELQNQPAEISAQMVSKVHNILSNIRWDKHDVARFLGKYLSEPKPDVFFDTPKPITMKIFTERLKKNGIQLSLKSQMLFHEEYCFINGELVEQASADIEAIRMLANQRKIPPQDFYTDALVTQLHAWYLSGYLVFSKQ